MVLEVKRAVENFPFLGKNANSCTPVILSIYGAYLHMYVIFLFCVFCKRFSKTVAQMAVTGS